MAHIYSNIKTLSRRNGRLQISESPRPAIRSADQVLIKVEKAAICRTDVRAARGLIKTAENLTLGHEFSGSIVELGSNSGNFKIAQRVAVMPILFCGKCTLCQKNQHSACQETKMLGIDVDGCFAEYVVVPAAAVYAISDKITFEQAAYAEPIAASLAVLKTGINKDQQGCIYGDNRIAILTARLLTVLGYRSPAIISKSNAGLFEKSSFSYGIETLATSECMQSLVDLIKPQGRLIIKSRQYLPVEVNIANIVKKELQLLAVNYAPFSQALEVLESGELDLTDLIGKSYSLSEYEEAFEADTNDESKKSFFNLG